MYTKKHYVIDFYGHLNICNSGVVRMNSEREDKDLTRRNKNYAKLVEKSFETLYLISNRDGKQTYIGRLAIILLFTVNM